MSKINHQPVSDIDKLIEITIVLILVNLQLLALFRVFLFLKELRLPLDFYWPVGDIWHFDSLDHRLFLVHGVSESIKKDVARAH